MSLLYIQNKSENEVVEFLKLDGVTVLGVLKPGQFVEVKTPPGKKIDAFVIREVKDKQ